MVTSRRRGFTLIEIMITIAIIGVIAAIAIPGALKARAKSKLSKCEQNLQVIARACDAFMNDYSDNKLHRTGKEQVLSALTDRHYLSAVPSCPCGGTYGIMTFEKSDKTNLKKYGHYYVYCSGGVHTAADCDEGNYPRLTAQGQLLRTQAEEDAL